MRPAKLQEIPAHIEAAGSGTTSDCDCLQLIREAVWDDSFNSGSVRLSECSRYSATLLADLYPQMRQFLITPDQTGLESKSDTMLSSTDGLALIIIEVLHGIGVFDADGRHRATAAKLAGMIISPIPKPNSPFNDEDPCFVVVDE